MNEFFIEEENTIYEIDPDCKIEVFEKEQKERGKCLEQRGRTQEIAPKKNSQWVKNDCSFCKKLLIICLICQGHQRKSDRRQQHIRCR